MLKNITLILDYKSMCVCILRGFFFSCAFKCIIVCRSVAFRIVQLWCFRHQASIANKTIFVINTIIKKIILILECNLICILKILNTLKITRNWEKATRNFSLECLTSSLIMQEVPDPVKFFVTRWSNDPWLQMAYSFVKTGGSGEAYDMIAEDIQGKVFFAGEVSISVN